MSGDQFLCLAGGMAVGSALVFVAGLLPWRWERERGQRIRDEQAAHDAARIAAFKAKLDRLVEVHRACRGDLPAGLGREGAP